MNREESNRLKDSVGQLCKLTEALSVHQRQLSKKIDEIHSHHVQLYAHQDRIYAQIDALFSIHALLQIRHPLPTMRGWPVSPDFVKLLMALILEVKPNLLVETGSGVSSIIAGYCLERNGGGRLMSYDHDETFARLSAKQIALHRLEDWVTIVPAPIRLVDVHGEAYRWYDPDCIALQDRIDLLVVDGPPGHLQRMARYPALPIFFNRLSEHAIVLLDDAARDDEKAIVEKWIGEYGCFDHEYVDTEKGAVVLRRTASKSIEG